jgi:hypothetical protein
MNQASVLDAGLSDTSGGALSLPSKEFDLVAFDVVFPLEFRLKCANDEDISRGSLEFPSAIISSLIGSYSLLAPLHGEGKITSSSRLIEIDSRVPGNFCWK